MSLEEYLQLMREGGYLSIPDPKNQGKRIPTKKKRVGKKDPKMARALRKANAMGRKKNKSFKKGWNQAKIMKKAHQLRRKMR